MLNSPCTKGLFPYQNAMIPINVGEVIDRTVRRTNTVKPISYPPNNYIYRYELTDSSFLGVYVCVCVCVCGGGGGGGGGELTKGTNTTQGNIVTSIKLDHFNNNDSLRWKREWPIKVMFTCGMSLVIHALASGVM